MSAAPAAAAPSAAAAPAASADPDRVWFYLSPATGAQCGPVTPGDIADLLIDRDINSSTLGWRQGLDGWVPLSSLPELKGIFATAFDASDEAPAAAQQPASKRAKQTHPAAASTAAASSAASAAASSAPVPAAPSDPAATWYFLDRSGATQGPVRVEEILRRYGLCEISDASMVCNMAPPPTAASAASSSAAPASTASQSQVGQWVRVGESAALEGRVGPELLEQYASERAAREADAKNKAEAQKKRKRDAAGAATTDAKAAEGAGKGAGGGGGGGGKRRGPSTSVYVSGLPPDTTMDELLSTMRKGGLIAEDDSGHKRARLYTDENGKLKGDALVTYALPDSVQLAITLLDGAVFRPKKPPPPPSARPSSQSDSASASEVENKDWIISVSKAEFSKDKGEQGAGKKQQGGGKQHNNSDAGGGGNGDNGGGGASEATDRRSRQLAQIGAMTAHQIARQRLREHLSWDESPVHSSRLRIVILKPLFTLQEAAAHPTGEERFYAELKAEVAEEVERLLGGGSLDEARGGRGAIEKLTIFASNPEGPAAIKFRSSLHAAQAIQLLNGRWFGGRQLAAFYFDGKTNYSVKRKGEETEEEESKRLAEFGDWLEAQEGQDEE